MNKIFKLVWSAGSNAWVAVSECAAVRGKKSSKSGTLIKAAIFLVPAAFASATHAASYNNYVCSDQAGCYFNVGDTIRNNVASQDALTITGTGEALVDGVAITSTSSGTTGSGVKIIGSGVAMIGSSTIHVTGNVANSHGIFGQNQGTYSVILMGSTITVSGNNNNGVSFQGGTFTGENGTYTTTGNNSRGVQATADNVGGVNAATVSLSGTSTISVSGNDSNGIRADRKGIVNAEGTINIDTSGAGTGANSDVGANGIRVQNGGTFQVSAAGTSIHINQGGGVAKSNMDGLRVTGGTLSGTAALSDAALTVTAGRYGIFAENAGAQITGSGAVDITVSGLTTTDTAGIYAQNGGKVNLSGTVAIQTTGADTYGLYARDNASRIILGSASITADNLNAWGARAETFGSITLGNGSNTNGTGLWASYGGTLFLTGSASASGSRVLLEEAGQMIVSDISDTAVIGSLEGDQSAAFIFNGKNLTIDNATGSRVDNANYAGHLVGLANLTKQGDLTQIFSGNTNWTGTTTIAGGALTLDGINGRAHLGSQALPGKIVGTSGTAFNLINGASFTGAIDPTNVNVGAASTWTMTGNSSVDSLSFGSGGALAFTAPAAPTGAFKTLVIQSSGGPNSSGILGGTGGTITMHTNLAAQEGDLIVADGTAGSHAIFVVNQGGNPSAAGQSLKIIDVQEPAKGLGSFSLTNPNGRVDAGAYQYSLVQGDKVMSGQAEDWYLLNTDVASTTTTGLLSLSSAVKTVVLASLNDLSQRLGAVRHDPKHGNDLWVRTWRSAYRVEPEGSARTDQYVNGVEIGLDRRFEMTDGRIYAGGLVGFGNSTSHTPATGGGGESAYYDIGAYATWVWESGLYVDLIGRHFWFDRDYHFRPNNQSEEASARNTAWSANLEMGRTITIGTAWFVEPQAELDVIAQPKIDFSTDKGNALTIDNGTHVVGRLGLAAGYLFGEKRAASVNAPSTSPANWTQLYSRLDFIKDVSGSDVVLVNGSRFETAHDKGSFLATLGLQTQQKDSQYHVEVSTGLGSPDIQKRWGVNLGARWRF